jgi:hypothetical protein
MTQNYCPGALKMRRDFIGPNVQDLPLQYQITSPPKDKTAATFSFHFLFLATLLVVSKADSQ